MNDELYHVYQITKQLEELLSVQVTSKNRAEVIDQVDELLEQRQKHLIQIYPPYSEQEKQVGKQVVQMNKHINQKMQIIFDALKKDIQQMNHQRKSTNSYTNPYKNVQTIDGMFMDSKQ